MFLLIELGLSQVLKLSEFVDFSPFIIVLEIALQHLSVLLFATQKFRVRYLHVLKGLSWLA